MKKILKWITISLSTLILVIVIISLVFLLLLTPKRLTPIVNKYATEFLNAKIDFDSVKVNLFEEFPKVSLKLTGGEVISYALLSDTAFLSEHPVSADTLLRFNEFAISLNVKDLLKSKINIQRIRISQPVVYGYISPSGQANWDIITLTGSDTPLDLNIDRFSIRGPASFNFVSCTDSMNLQASIGRLFLRGKITPDIDKLEINKFVCSAVKFDADLQKSEVNACLVIDSAAIDVIERAVEYGLQFAGAASATVAKQNYCESLPVNLNGALKINPKNLNSFGFKNFCLSFANLPAIKLNGDITLSEGDIDSDLECKIEALPLQALFDLIPQNVSAELKKIETDVKISLSTYIKGNYEFSEHGKLPVVNVDFKIPKGHLLYKDSDSKIDNLAIDASLHFNPVSPKKTGIELRKINIEGFAVKLDGYASIKNLLDDPDVSMKIEGAANLRELQKFLPDDLGVTARGTVAFNADCSFLLSRLNTKDLAQNNLVAFINADKLRVRFPQESIGIVAEKTNLELNTTKTRTNRNTGEEMRLLTLEFHTDTARVRLPSRETVALSKVDFSMRTSDAVITGDTSKVIPMTGNVWANSVEYSGTDSSTVRLRDMKSSVRILPSKENRTLPTIRFEIESKQFSLLSEGNRISVRDANVSITATKQNPAQRRTTGTTANNRRARQTGRDKDDFAGEDLDIKNPKLSKMLREWNLTGTVTSRTGRVVSPLFPLRTRVQNLNITFSSNDIKLQNIEFRCGNSMLNLNGKIDGIQRALSSGRGLKFEAHIQSDTLDINQLLTAAYNGSAYSNASEEYKKAIAQATDEEQLEQIIQDENEGKEETSPLIVVPSNISMDVGFDIGYGKFADITIDKLTGEIVSRDRCIQLKDFDAKTNIGDINLTALYATRSKKDITFGIDLEFKDIQVEDIIHVIPSIDSLVPMLASFQGVVNCQVAATALMDTTMNLVLPSLNAACRISGKDMVLLDGQTFAEIAKTLKFKNREKNLVDNISVELLVNNNQIEIFPFIMEIDRYRTAVSGIQNLDMSFDYHISVLKSPLPFKLGVNIKGNFATDDKMKIGLGKAKYKDTHLPTYVTVIDATRFNLSEQINNFIQQGVDVARFSQFSAPKIDPSLIENEVDLNTFSAKDSLELYKQGIIEVAPASLRDSLP